MVTITFLLCSKFSNQASKQQRGHGQKMNKAFSTPLANVAAQINPTHVYSDANIIDSNSSKIVSSSSSFNGTTKMISATTISNTGSGGNTEVLPLLQHKEHDQTIIQSLGPYDILCGRCKTAFNNIGNRRFRVTISLNLKAYLKTNTRNEKSVLIASLVNFLRDDVGARFVKPHKKQHGAYVELSLQEARGKVGHALRDLAVAKQQSTMAEWAQQQKQIQAKQQQEQQEQHRKEQQQKEQQNKHVESMEIPTEVLSIHVPAPAPALVQQQPYIVKKWVEEEDDDISVETCLENLYQDISHHHHYHQDKRYSSSKYDDSEPLPIYFFL